MSEPEAREATEDDRTIGRRLKELRTARGLSQAELAERMVEAGRVHFGQSTVSKIERGIQSLWAEDMQALAKVFGPEAERLWVFEWKKDDDLPFWDRLGYRGDLPTHFPISVNRDGQGPTEPEPAHHYTCWCGDVECPLSIALHYGWLSGRRSLAGTDDSVRAVAAQTRAEAVREFVQWIAGNRAYNGAKDPGQSLYNEGLNGVLPKWAEDFLDERAGDHREDTFR